MSNYYSQHGEDYILDIVFSELEDGFFVEVGCIDGLRFSNTLTFEERGWSGMCVEAHSEYIGLLKENRPKSIVCHCAAGEEDADDVPFYANDRGSLSTLDEAQEENFRENYGDYFSGFERQSVEKRRLDSLFEKHNVPHKIDILSLDIEGYEVEAIKGMSFDKFRPRVLVIESDSSDHENSLDSILIKKGYEKKFRIRQNIFYFEYGRLAHRIEKNEYKTRLTHTAHPLDEDGDEEIEKTVRLYKYNLKNSIKDGVVNSYKRLRKMF